jgi:hypothetical protein
LRTRFCFAFFNSKFFSLNNNYFLAPTKLADFVVSSNKSIQNSNGIKR